MSDEESRPAKRTYRWSSKRVTSENRRDSESNYLEDVDASKLRVTKLPLPRNTLLQAASRYTSKFLDKLEGAKSDDAPPLTVESHFSQSENWDQAPGEYLDIRLPGEKISGVDFCRVCLIPAVYLLLAAAAVITVTFALMNTIESLNQSVVEVENVNLAENNTVMLIIIPGGAIFRGCMLSNIRDIGLRNTLTVAEDTNNCIYANISYFSNGNDSTSLMAFEGPSNFSQTLSISYTLQNTSMEYIGLEFRISDSPAGFNKTDIVNKIKLDALMQEEMIKETSLFPSDMLTRLKIKKQVHQSLTREKSVEFSYEASYAKYNADNFIPERKRVKHFEITLQWKSQSYLVFTNNIKTSPWTAAGALAGFLLILWKGFELSRALIKKFRSEWKKIKERKGMIDAEKKRLQGEFEKNSLISSLPNGAYIEFKNSKS